MKVHVNVFYNGPEYRSGRPIFTLGYFGVVPTSFKMQTLAFQIMAGAEILVCEERNNGCRPPLEGVLLGALVGFSL